MASPRYSFNPNAVVTRESNCLRALEKVIPTLLQNEQGELVFECDPISVGYYTVDGALGEDFKYALCIGFPLRQRDFSEELYEALKQKYGNDAVCHTLGDVLVGGSPTNDPIHAMVVISHQFIARFFHEICHGVALYKDHYSMVRDFYCISGGNGESQFEHNKDKRIDNEMKGSLFSTYERLHKAYHYAPRLKTALATAAHHAHGSHYLAPLFKTIYHSASSDVEIHERLNALIHAYHLGDQFNVNPEPQAEPQLRIQPEAAIHAPVQPRLPSFQNRLEEKDERARMADVYDDGLLTVVQNGDMFYEISEAFKKDPTIHLAYVSPDNRYRCGSAAILGNRGSVEEALVRTSDYVPKALASVVYQPPGDPNAPFPPAVEQGIHPLDPQGVLLQLYQNLQPTGRELTLSSACGVYYLAGQRIPEYIPLHQAKAYSEFAFERLHVARDMANGGLGNGYEDRYAELKQNPHRVDDVNFLDATGTVRKVSVVGMVGIDGKRPEPGSIASKLVFEDNHVHDDKGFTNGRFDINKTVTFYKDQWEKAFDSVLNANPKIDVFVLNPVGCGGFDPSSDGKQFTRASAEGFRDALQVKREALKAAGIRLIFPIYDMKKVYPHYKEALDLLFNHLKLEIDQQCIGGTKTSCIAVIQKKYQELGGNQFNFEGKSLEEIFAHALTKPRKMRDTLFALGYLKREKGGVIVGEFAPNVVKTAFAEVNDINHEFRVREMMVEDYKQARGYIHKNKFDIFNKSMSDILEHASEKNGNARKALMLRGYLRTQGDKVVLNQNADIPDCVKKAFQRK